MSNVIKKVIKNWVEYDIYANGWAAGAGDVNWPASATNWHLAVFDWTTGKIIKDWWAVPTSKSAASWWTDTSLVTTWEKYTWNNKQDALTTQTAYTTKWTATKVPTITTNTLWQVTAITETNISFPVTSVNSNTWAVTVNEVPTWWTEWQVLTKGSSGYSWATPASWWIENVTTWTTSTVTGIWAGTETEHWALSTKSWTVLYFTF